MICVFPPAASIPTASPDPFVDVLVVVMLPLLYNVTCPYLAATPTADIALPDDKLVVISTVISAPNSLTKLAAVKLLVVIYPAFTAARVPVPVPPYCALFHDIVPWLVTFIPLSLLVEIL